MLFSRFALSFCVLVFSVAFVAVVRAADLNPGDPFGWFQPNPSWSRVSEVRLSPDFTTLQATGRSEGGILFFNGDKPQTAQLRSQGYLGDCIVQMDFMLGSRTHAAVYLQGRYRVELSGEAMGTVGPLSAAADGASGEAVAPLIRVPGKFGIWQKLEARLRAPRFDDARNRTQNALLLEVKIDGKVVQSNTVQTTWSTGSEFPWDDAGGQTTVSVTQGSFALQNFSLRPADFGAIKVPAVSGQPTNTAKLIDRVKQGEENFRAFGCMECHATQRDDTAAKVGPNLFGLFRNEPRERAIVSGGEGHRFTVKADRSYLQRSLREPTAEIAIGEQGPFEGKPYPPAMPPFAPTVVSDAQLDAIGSYLMTLNEVASQGPVVRLVEVAQPENYDPMADRLQLLVDGIVRIQRGPMEHVSARAIHVGQPNAINYTFDPRVLGIVQVWQGGFLDLAGELRNRGGRGLKIGYQGHLLDLGTQGALLAPLNSAGRPVDFTFKEAVFGTGETIRETLNSPRDHLDRLAEVDAQFLGYARDSRQADAAPTFNYRVGKNLIRVSTEFGAEGGVTMRLSGDFTEPQAFAINDQTLKNLEVSEGRVEAGRWSLAPGRDKKVTAKGQLALTGKAWHAAPSTFDYRRQPLVVEPSTPTLPRGYRAERYLGPKDNYGREMLFEALGLAVAPDGTVVVASRTAGIWRLSGGQWQLFAEGLFDSLGVQIEDEHGLVVVAGQKPELTRIRDTDGDGIADSYETVTDAFSYHGNYHSYLHGPVRDADGNYLITLNLDDATHLEFEYRANGKYMGTGGGFRGWAARVPAKGGFEPWANGLRSPAGLGFGPDGRLWYSENQGEYVGTSKLFVMKKGSFYGHPAGLVDLPGMTPVSPEIAWEQVWQKRERPVVLFPEGRLANSPGSPLWDTINGKFGAFMGQMFIGDQTQSVLMRVVTETVDGVEQGAVIPFATDLESGVMRQVWLPDDSMLIGETGRGWQAKGGRVASLQRLIWDGKTVPPAIHRVSAIAGGFQLQFTVQVPDEVKASALAPAIAVQSWTYRDAADYGSPELDDHNEEISHVELTPDRRALRVFLAKTEQPTIHPQQTARVYHLVVAGKTFWPDAGPGLDAFYTLYRFPAATATGGK